MAKQTPKPALKETKVQLRLRPAEKALLARAARLRQITLSKFVLENAIQAAEEALADQAQFTLSPARWRAFCQALDAPPRPIPALIELFNRASVFDDFGNPSSSL